MEVDIKLPFNMFYCKMYTLDTNYGFGASGDLACLLSQQHSLHLANPKAREITVKNLFLITM